MSKFPPIEVRYYSSVTSTNEVARELLSRDGGNGTMIVADHQTKGRGRRGRKWHSPAGVGLWATLILRPGFAGKGCFTLGLAAAVAISETVEKMIGLKSAIQWPNDLILEGRKYGGILVEIVHGRNREQFALLGMGINLNQKKGEFPPGIREIATSLREVSGHSVDRDRFLLEMNAGLEKTIQKVYDGGFDMIRAEYTSRSNLLQEWITVKLEKGRIEGRVIAFGPFGELMLSLEGGIIRKLTHGEVHKVWR